MDSAKNQEGFTDLSEYRKLAMPNVQPQANIIKGMHIVHRGTEEVHRAEQDPDQPEVFVHRDGDNLVSIDFVCKCGRSTSLRFEYDEE